MHDKGDYVCALGQSKGLSFVQFLMNCRQHPLRDSSLDAQCCCLLNEPYPCNHPMATKILLQSPLLVVLLAELPHPRLILVLVCKWSRGRFFQIDLSNREEMTMRLEMQNSVQYNNWMSRDQRMMFSRTRTTFVCMPNCQHIFKFAFDTSLLTK